MVGWGAEQAGEMLVRGLSIEEIARGLRRDHREVSDKVAEVAWRAGRTSSAENLGTDPLSSTGSPVQVIAAPAIVLRQPEQFVLGNRQPSLAS